MEPDYISAFDALHTNNFIQKLKILHAFSDAKLQHFMAVYIKFLEFQYTLTNTFCCHTFDGSVNTILEALCPFSSPALQKQLKQLGELWDLMETAKTISETMELMKDIFPEETFENTAKKEDASESSPCAGQTSMEQLLLNMLSDDQRSLFESLIKTNE